MIKFYLKSIFYIVNLAMLLLPATTCFMAIHSVIAPDMVHERLIQSKVSGKAIWVGYDGGSVSCMNNICDNSDNNITKTYLVWPESYKSDTFFKVINTYSGSIEIEEYPQQFVSWFTLMLCMLVYGIVSTLIVIVSKIKTNNTTVSL